jgi:hypothetical protein
MMKCPTCLFENPEDSKFCFECGSKIESACPQCSNPLPPGVKFCNRCGFDLRGPQPSPIDASRPASYTPKHLRATLGLSRLLQQEGRSEEAHQFLSEIYGWFTEGFDTPDLKEAKALLEEFQKEGGKEGRGVLG